METSHIEQLQESTDAVRGEQRFTEHNLQQFSKHFDKYYSQLSNAVEDMRAEVQMLRNDNAVIFGSILDDVEEGEVCKKCGQPLI